MNLLEELTSQEWKKKIGPREKELLEEWPKKSRSYYETAIKKDLGFAPAYKGLGEWHFDKKEWEASKKYFDEYLKRAPEARDRRSVLRYIKDIESSLAKGAPS